MGNQDVPLPSWRLPERPAGLSDRQVAAWRSPVVIPSYAPLAPEAFPAFLNERVYQGSDGRVYPLPFVEKIATEPEDRSWDALHIENEFVRLMVLPELGGRIQVGYDKAHDYDFFYRNPTVKPALVGLAGPWVSGGVEFNWPQHHRPATNLPTQSDVVLDQDGSATLWCADHDPFARLRAWHGVTLRPDTSAIELKVRLHNRTELRQTFLWWANVAVAVHDGYQSFFPPDVTFVADHAGRATVSFPRARTPYYGIDYPSRVDAGHPDADRLDWFRNIPVPTSYMVTRSEGAFFGGYDHAAGAGFVHWADPGISPGKKQWTWGNAPFGQAWDRNLSDDARPYIELMAGVYTDNQPDFTFLAPGETKTFSQFWYPIAEIGVVRAATLDAALHASAGRVGVYAPRALEGRVELSDDAGRTRWSSGVRLAPHASAVWTQDVPADAATLHARIVADDGRVVLAAPPVPPESEAPVPPPAVPPRAPADIASADELYLVGRHLDQYRHATRDPEPYWLEALRRDPGDSRCHAALAERAYRRGDYAAAAAHASAAVARLTTWNKNPETTQAHYLLGLAQARSGRATEAEAAWHKATWDRAWAVPALEQLAAAAASRHDDTDALALADRALAAEPHHGFLAGLRAVLLRRSGRADAADAQLASRLAFDPLDPWARDQRGDPATADPQLLLDVARMYHRAGEDDGALRLLRAAAQAVPALGQTALGPLVRWTALAWGLDPAGLDAEGEPGVVGLDDLDVVRAAADREPSDPLPPRLLGDWAFHHRRPREATALWTRSFDAAPSAVAARNLGIAAVHAGDLDLAADWYDRAAGLAPGSATLLHERDGLASRRAEPPAARLARLDAEAAAARDDLVIARATLLTVSGRAPEAVALLAGRRFQPWEGGEGAVLGAWEWAQLFASGLTDAAPIRAALEPPAGLGEARHPLANRAHLLWALGEALAASGDDAGADEAWRTACREHGDFQVMASVTVSELTFFSILAAARLLRHRPDDDEARRFLTASLEALRAHVAAGPRAPDLFFATSLPQSLPFPPTYEADHARRLRLMAAQLRLLDGHDARPGLDALAAESPDWPLPLFLSAYTTKMLNPLDLEVVSPNKKELTCS